MFIEKVISISKFIAGAVFCNAIGVLSSFFVGFFGNFQGNSYSGPGTPYASLRKSALSPPTFIFGPIWFFLYSTMGIGAVMIIMSYGVFSLPFYFFSAQILFNFLWYILFFGFNKTNLAMLNLVIIDILYFIMLGSIYYTPAKKAMDQDSLKIASQVAFSFGLLTLISLVFAIPNSFSGLRSMSNSGQNIVVSRIMMLLVILLFNLVFFGIDIPSKYSGLSTNHAIFLMLLPTALWISFATYLNWSILYLNSNS